MYEELAEQARQSIIRDDLATYQRIWDMLLAEPGIYYYASNGSETYTNSPDESLAFFEASRCIRFMTRALHLFQVGKGHAA